MTAINKHKGQTMSISDQVSTALPMPELEQEHRIEAKVLQYQQAGYTILQNAVPLDLLVELQARFDQYTEKIIRERGEEWRNYGRRFQIDELKGDDAFQQLSELLSLHPLILCMARTVWQRNPKFRNTYGSVHFGGEASNQSWHNDARYPEREGVRFIPFLIRASMLMDEVTEDMGPTALMPGSHGTRFSPPAWVHTADRQPRELPGMLKFTGKAGDILLNDVSIWHANTPNLSCRARKLVWLLWEPGLK